MAKMRYTEIPKDLSSESLSALKIIDEKNEDKGSGEEEDCREKLLPSKWQSKSPRKNSFCKVQSSGEDEYKEQLLPTSSNNSSKPPPGKSPRKNSFGKGQSYDNPTWIGGGKSWSLPADSSLQRNPVLEALRISPEDLASQLTLLDIAVFSRIAPDELTSCAWNKKDKLTVAPNVVAFTQRFNHVSFWTVQEVLNGSTPKLRAEILIHFIKICKKLYELNNFHSLFAIISGLQTASVYRLSKTWSCVPKKDKQSFDKLAEVFSDKDNWKRLREHVESLKLPCIPYLGVFLTDLVYIDMAQPGRSCQRAAKMNNVLRIVSTLQESSYSELPTLPHIQRYLRSVRYIDELQKFVEDDQYKLSMKLEPENGKDCSTVDASPAKSTFIPGHTKSNSLGSNVLNMDHNQSSSGRHLLDDSLLEEHSARHKSLLHLNLSPLKRLPAAFDEDIEASVVMQGCLRRKTLLKEGRKPAVASWQRYWVQLWANCLVFYLPKAFKGNDRGDYRKEPCKVAPMAGCLVSLSDNPTQPDIFHLRDPIKSNLYKFKAGSRDEASDWISSLQETLGLCLDPAKPPNNLISFE